MIKLDRAVVAVPESLAAPAAAVTAEKNAAAIYYGSLVVGAKFKAYKFEEYRAYDVREALRVIGNGKCAYCESRMGGVAAREVEHYRPKGGVVGTKHRGYWWLAHDWDNLLPSCPGCNKRRRSYLVTPGMTPESLKKLREKEAKESHGKGNHFPIRGVRATTSASNLQAEDPLLIDPTVREPGPELCWLSNGPLSIVAPSVDVDGQVSPYGEVTIKCCALNRVELVEDRTLVLDELKNDRLEIMKDLEADATSPGALTRALERAERLRRRQASNMPYSAMVKSFIDELIEELSRSVPAGAAAGAGQIAEPELAQA